MLIQLYLFVIVQLFSCFTIEIKPKLTFDELFDYTSFPFLKFSPTGQHLLIQTKRTSWNTSSYENTLWLYNVQNRTKKVITTNVRRSIKPQWSPSGDFIAFLPKNHSLFNKTEPPQDKQQSEQYIYLYSVISDELFPIQIGNDTPLAFAWSNNDSSIFLAVTHSRSLTEENDSYKDEWKDVIQYRRDATLTQSIIYRIDLNSNNPALPVEKNIIRNVSSLISQLLYVSFGEKLIFSSVSALLENLDGFELYSIDLQNTSTLSKLTNNEALEFELQLSADGRHLLFRILNLNSNKGKLTDTQYRLYSLNIINGVITRLGESFRGSIYGYTVKPNSGVYILGQLGTEVQIYTQQSPTEDLIRHIGWNGTYESIVSSNNNGSIAFVYSSLENPMEVYLINNINQLKSAEAITEENNLFTRRNLPQTKVYSWINEDDQRVIEGILHYPPGKFESKNLPLLVLIHGGPYWASINQLDLDWHNWATLAASEGWLVLEPNYRGSTGYGDQFLNEIRYKPVSRPGKDILYGVDQLIKDKIVDPYKLAVGGYSYGGFLTNWLITQTKRFNAALSGAGVVDHTSAWGTMDLPILMSYLFGGFPWEVPHIYQNEAPFYQLNRVRTPTHIVIGEKDIRVPASQSYILERGLHYLGIPVKLISFPKEGHSVNNNPWYGKIKVREELKWLQKYGNQSMNHDELFNNSEKSKLTYALQLYMFLFLFIVTQNI
jgi:dipeptidyl aminopeptidase/acylaminoacyl peptidase